MNKLNDDINRSQFIQAHAYAPSFRYDSYYNTENFNIKLQSIFVPNRNQEIILKIVGTMKENNVWTIGDDDISRAVTMKTGVDTVADVKDSNPVTFIPYWTLVEGVNRKVSSSFGWKTVRMSLCSKQIVVHERSKTSVTSKINWWQHYLNTMKRISSQSSSDSIDQLNISGERSGCSSLQFSENGSEICYRNGYSSSHSFFIWLIPHWFD